MKSFEIDNEAKYIGYKPDKNGVERWQGAVPALIKINGVVFMSLSPKDEGDAQKYNKALSDFVNSFK